MFTQALWWVGNAMEALLLVRATKTRLFKKYPVFYIYLSWIFLCSLLRFYVYVTRPALHQPFFWYTQFVTVLVGYILICEIYKQALAHYPGAAQMARNCILGVFAVVISRALAHALSGSGLSAAKTTAEIERNLRSVQAILLLIFVGLLVYYAIPIGRNLKGIVLGYGFFIGASVINLTFRSHLGTKFQLWLQYLQSTAFALVLLVWCSALWSPQPDPEPDGEIEIERDYDVLVSEMTKRFAQLRGYLGRSVRS